MVWNDSNFLHYARKFYGTMKLVCFYVYTLGLINGCIFFSKKSNKTACSQKV